MSVPFVHLHVHSHFSLLDGAAAPEALAARAAALGMPALALTDHDALFGAVRFYRAAKEAGVHPIVGLELAVGPEGRHVTLLAADETGYRNLCRLSTAAMSGGPSETPGSGARGTGSRSVPLELLWEAGDGLIVLSGCRRGLLATPLLAGRPEEARRVAARFRDRFGPDRFFVELQQHGRPDDEELTRRLAALADELQLPVVATNNVHYLSSEDAEAHDVLLVLGAGARLADPQRPRFPTREFYLKSPEEMQRLFAHRPEALENTLRIAERCQVDLGLGGRRLPRFFPDEAAAAAALRQRACEGARRRFGDPLPEPVAARLEHELGVIAGAGLSDYFLLVAEIVELARRRGIPVGPGRGSAAGSLTAYCLFITDVDPLEHGLLFERFLNPQRLQMPDIDVDVCDVRREELLAEVRRRFGADRVAQIATFGTLAARAALRDVGRVLDLPAGEVDALARLVPDEPGVTLAEAKRRVPALAQAAAGGPGARLLALAEAVEGTPRHMSIHAAGIVIGDKPLAGELPLVQAAGGAAVTQYPMEDIQALGYVKMDLLGLRTLTVLDNVRRAVRARGVPVPERLPLDDQRVYEALRRYGTEGVFQLETPMFQRLSERLGPRRFADLAALLALGRPGPAERVDEFIRRRNGQAPVRYHHPKLAPILEETYGIIVYQEQVMRIAVEVAGYSPAEADLFRRAMSAKDPAIMAAQEDRFVAGAVAGGVPEPVARRIFGELAAFAGYGFNKSHSVAYALLSYETAYWRTHFPAEFFAALLSSWRGHPQRIARYVAAARKMGVQVLPPDVNTSPADFAAAGGAVAFGLSGLRHVSEAAAQAIVAARRDGPFTSLADLARRLPSRFAHRRLFESLIEAGACDGFGVSRSELLRQLERLDAGGGAVAQTSLFGGEGAAARPAEKQECAGSDFSATINEGEPLVLSVPAGAARHFPALRRLLEAHPGPAPVLLRIDAGDRTVVVETGLKVAPTAALLDKLKREAARGRITGAGFGGPEGAGTPRGTAGAEPTTEE